MSRIACMSFIRVIPLFLFAAIPTSSPAQTYNESVLYAPSSSAISRFLFSPLIQASDGNFYGVSLNDNDASTVFKVSPGGKSAVVYTFPYYNWSTVGLTQGGDGNLYGVLAIDSDSSHFNWGKIFKISPSGNYSEIYTFCPSLSNGVCVGGLEPEGALVQGSDGNFYGTTELGGTNGDGTIFKITPSGVLTTLYNFCSQGGSACTDGMFPQAGLLQGSDGNFYGTTTQGGMTCPTHDPSWVFPGCGVVYKITPSGNYSVVHTFAGGNDGSFPQSGLVEGAGSVFFGTVFYGPNGAFSGGDVVQGPSAVYEITPSGTATAIYNLTGGLTNPSGNAEDISDGIEVGSDGNLYGNDTNYDAQAVDSSSPETYGGVYQLTPTGVATVLYGFLGSPDGASPYAAPLQGADGSFYGTTAQGGNGFPSGYQSGTVYKLAVSPALLPPVALTLSKQSINVGETITLNWSVANAYSMTLQQCYAFVQGSASGGGTWTGLQAGTSDPSATPPYTGSATITPTANGTYTYALTCGGMESGFATLTVGTGTTQLTVNTSSLPSGTVGTAYSQTVKATGGATPYKWSVSSGKLSAGLSLAPATGIISGKPTAATTSSFTIEVTDSESTPQTATASLSITVIPVPLAITTSSLPSGKIGKAYSQTLKASGGVTPYKWSIALGTLPPGLSLAPATGIISGKPTAATISNFTIEVQDSAGTPQTATAGLSISVSPAALTITTSSLSSGKVGKTYSQTLKASGGVAPYAWSVSSGKLPAGLSLAATTGIISGKPSLAATSSFTIGVHDSQSTPFSVRRGYQLRISK